MQLPTFKRTTIRLAQQLAQQDGCAVSIDLKDGYLHIPMLSITIIFLELSSG